jgi:hypothetical protein
MNLIQVHPSGWGFCERGGGPAFTPWGCNYYDPATGWSPRLWEQFDAGRVGAHFDQIRSIGGNAVRVFATVMNLMDGPAKVSAAGLAKMERMLNLAGDRGLRVIWSGPSLWEGAPAWWQELTPYEAYVRPELISAQQVAWRGMAGAMRGHPALLAYELHNEPFAPWRPTPVLGARWAQWRAQFAPGAPAELPAPTEPLQADWSADFQRFREHLAAEYVGHMTAAIRETDDTHLVTIGLHQKSAPFDWYPPDPYTAFNPHQFAAQVDYTSVHFYPHHPFHPNLYRDPYETAEGMAETLTHARAVARYLRVAGKPVVMEECGWYGGGAVLTANREQPARSEADQTAWCTNLVAATRGDVCGWLFWPYRDTPSSLDASRHSGLFNAAGELKDWGHAFAGLAPGITGSIPAHAAGTRVLDISWEELVTQPERIKACRAAYLAAFGRGDVVDFAIH